MSKPKTLRKGSRDDERWELFILRRELYMAKAYAMSSACQVQISAQNSQKTEEMMFYKRLHT